MALSSNEVSVEKTCSDNGFLSLHYHDQDVDLVCDQCDCESCQNCDSGSCNCHGNSS